MTDIVTFLRARLDEDEKIADVIIDPSWSAERREVRAEGGHLQVANALTPKAADHIARHDPARVLREVEAKRRIVGQCQTIIDNPETYSYQARNLAEDMIWEHATVYSDHPDYRQEWKP